MLVNLFVHYLELGVSSVIAKFADDTKLADDKLHYWATTWLMKFSIGNKIKNSDFKYMLLGFDVAAAEAEKHFVAVVGSLMKIMTQYLVVVKKTNSVWGLLGKR